VVCGDEGEGEFKLVTDDGNADKVGDLLLETIWDADVEPVDDEDVGVRIKRNMLADLMSVELSEKCREGKGKQIKRKKFEDDMEDVHESYQSLVDTKGY